MKIHDDVLLLRSTTSMPLLKVPVTTTAIRTSRGVVVIAPGQTIDEVEAQLVDFGRVTDLVAPNLFHHKSILKAARAFPQATIWGANGFKEKRPDVPWNKFLSETNWMYQDEIQLIEVRGLPMLNESVFFHSSSKTLVVTDLFFNVLNARGLGARIVLKLMFDVYNRFALPNFILRALKKQPTDRAAFQNSLLKIAALDFDKIVVGHGEPVLKNARDLFMSALKERELL